MCVYVCFLRSIRTRAFLKGSTKIHWSRCSSGNNTFHVWWVITPPVLTLGGADKVPWRSSQNGVAWGQQPIGYACRFLSFSLRIWNPRQTPIVTRMEGSFSCQGVSTKGGEAPARGFAVRLNDSRTVKCGRLMKHQTPSSLFFRSPNHMLQANQAPEKRRAPFQCHAFVSPNLPQLLG